ncbi:coiled-coil domain-containing protein 74B [Discoglossus pictus]
MSPLKPPRPPTTTECENIINHLWRTNNKLIQELQQIKCFLRNIIQDDECTPESQHIAEGFLEGTSVVEEAIQLTDEFAKDNAISGMPNSMAVEEKASLPALRPTPGNNFAERRKKVQFVKKNCARRAPH